MCLKSVNLLSILGDINHIRISQLNVRHQNGHNIDIYVTTGSCGHNIYTSTRACGHNGGCGMCTAVHALQPLACYVKHSEHQLLLLCCAAMCACRQKGAEWRTLAPFRGCGPKKQSISLLPTARRSFSFIDSCPPIPSCPNHPQSLQMLQSWNHQFHQLQSMTN